MPPFVNQRDSARNITAALDGKWHGSYGMARCVCHDDSNPSMSIRDGDNGELWPTCHAGCDRRNLFAELRRRGLLDDRVVDRQHLRVEPRPTKPEPPPADRIRAVLSRSTALRGSLGERYLRGRDLDPDLVDPAALRFLPGIGKYVPAMVAVVTDFTDAAHIVGLQFTPLMPDATRGERTFMRGSRIGGGVIRLVDDAEVATDLGLAEGVETALAAMTAMRRAGRLVLPAWSALNAGNLGALPVLSGIERLTIYIDADDAGRKGGGNLAARWHHAGREVFIATPPRGDWNEAAA